MKAAELEQAVVAHLRERDFERAATVALEAYGPEVLGLLVALHRNRADADDVFGTFCEDLWAGLPGFRGDASLRTWVYVLARNASSRFLRDPKRRRDAPLSAHPALSQLEAKIRTGTPSFLGAEAKDLVSRLRSQLAPDDQTLLILHLDREMRWEDVAKVMGSSAAAVRKRYERVKGRLKELAESERERS